MPANTQQRGSGVGQGWMGTPPHEHQQKMKAKGWMTKVQRTDSEEEELFEGIVEAGEPIHEGREPEREAGQPGNLDDDRGDGVRLGKVKARGALAVVDVAAQEIRRHTAALYVGTET